MFEIAPFLSQLISTPGLSGFEGPVRNLIAETWKDLTDEMHTSRLGSLHALRKGTGQQPRPRIMIDAHMDAIGLIISGFVGEFARITAIGGLDPRVLIGQLVTIHGREEVQGVVVCPPAHLLPTGSGDPPASLDYLLVDAGYPVDQLEQKIRSGDPVSFAQMPIQMSADFLTGHSLDNRASLAALTYCLTLLQNHTTYWDVWMTATALEEVSLGGAATTAFQLQPDIAVVVDVTFGKGPGSPDYQTFPLGKGPTLSWGPMIHPGLHKAFRELADRLEITWQFEPIAGFSSTNTDRIHSVAQGIPTMLLEIPLRYMHSATEMVSINDIQNTGRLIAEFITGLDAEFLKRLTRDD